MTTLKTAVPGVTITENGLLVPDIADVLSGRLTDIDSAMGGGGSKSLSSPQGQISQSDTEIIATNYDALLCLFNQMNPDYATGRWQDGIGSIYFMERISARGTIVTATCTGAVGTLIPAGSTAMDDAGYTYASISDATIAATGSVDIEFQNLTTGAIACDVGALNQIFAPISGWDSISNDASGVLGIDVESRVAFETRRKQSVARSGRNTDASLLANILATDGVSDAYVWSNREDVIVNKGSTSFPVKSHSVYVCAYGGADADVAEAIFANKNPGANLNGDTTYVIEDKDNYSAPYPQYTMQWQKASPLRVYFKVQIENDSVNLPSDVTDQIKSMVASVFNGSYEGITKARIGSRISGGVYYAPVITISPEYMSILSITISSDGELYSQYITAGIDQIPTIQLSDIEVIKV
ncbi:baseplate J/gp47 family protein [Erwinia tracheiphila]|uniref:Bacteriophage protein n=1 Tax=Erwinia tracheiphila TaxID=65700 RepID=A0A0M2KI91_9GAMM|nr:baseplate J/gp47 family protein [Erwinia tracheiphila]EOS94768.1 phage gp47-like protein [Erwinia tracheiphila PSU-1]KKF37027.1 bacteriophage protein [Erwinia tracheiphila]UIA88378.1 baseplate J/gp47 family protein [Erwinia tracheiphila]UIA96201.1 baseplate J/gp47 family protein [Erwinia tracheiphila]